MPLIDYTNYNSLGLPQWQDSEQRLRTGIMTRIATNGRVRTRALQSATKRDPVVSHGLLTDQQVTDFLNFYEGVGQGGRTRTFSFTSAEDGITRTCLFNGEGPYHLQRRFSGGHRLTVYLLEY